MKQLLAILFASGFTYAVSLLAGKLLLKLLRVRLSRLEEHFLGFILGAACLSTVVFALTAAGLAHRGIFLAAGLVIIAVAFCRGAHRFSNDAAVTPLPKHWKIAFTVLYGAFGILYLGSALLPEASGDGVAYHVAFPASYVNAHHFPRITTNLYANYPEGAEMLFLFAFAFGKHTAAAMVHLLFTLLTPLGMLAYGRRIGSPVTGAAGALLFFLSPVVGKAGSSAYVDVAMAGAVFAVFLLLEIWRQQPRRGLLVAIGLAAGFAFAIKYLAGPAVLYAAGAVAFHLWRAKKPFLRPALLMAGLSLLMMAPWMIKNAAFVNNPLSPFANRLFPNPYVSAWLEDNLSRFFRERITPLEIPREVLMDGSRLYGVIGPVFLLSPLLLLGLTRPAGRQLALAALLFGIPFLLAPETRYLIPPLLFISLCMCFALTRWPAAGVTLVLLHALLSWPPVLTRYVHPYCWRLEFPDWRAALRLTPEADFLRSHLYDYDVGLTIEKTVPPGQPVLSFSGIQRAYHSHEIIVEWTSSFGVRISEMLRTPVTKALQPTRRHDYRFATITARKIRLVQTTRSDRDRWSISELTVLRQGQALPRAPEWRLRASTNPWDVTLAFDNSPVTRWTSGEAYQPGMFVEMDFGHPEAVDQVVADCTQDQEQMRMRLEYEDSPGHWKTILENAARYDTAPPDRMRGAAIQEAKSNHVEWLLVHDLETNRGADDFYHYQKLWGIRLAATSGQYKLYHLE
jgi:hypothetical protein